MCCFGSLLGFGSVTLNGRSCQDAAIGIRACGYKPGNKYRIEEAKKMLVDSAHKNTTITDIYLAVGFNSKSVFYTFFKKSESITPTQFRQSSLAE